MTRLFLLALAVLAVHVIGDSFVAPRPGTSATDHLASGLVPLAVLALTAYAFPRLRPGARASIALTLGVLALGASVEAVYYGEGTGFAAIPAALALFGIGIVTLWHSRRRDAWRYLRRPALGIAGLLVFLTTVVPVGAAYVRVHVARDEVPAPRLGAPHENVTLTTSDGLRLKGWYVPSRNGAAVIAFPGRKGPQPHARMLIRHGYGVLLLDRRGEGESEGEPSTRGWGGARDLQAAVAYLQRRPDVRDGRIGGLGLSVGGELMIEAAASTPALKAVVSEGAGIRSLREMLDIPSADKWLLVPFMAIETAATTVLYNHTPPPNLGDLAAKVAPRPLLLISAEHGQGGEIELNPVFHRRAGASSTHWEIPGSGHIGGIRAAPEEYERRVVGFLDAALR
jgi:hypothetical protein